VKTTSFILFGMLLGLSVESASASVITVNVTAHVKTWEDTTGLFQQISEGQAVTATYTYDTSTASVAPGNGYDWYYANSVPDTISVSTGALTFQSQAGTQLQMLVAQSPASGQPSIFQIGSQVGMPLASGEQVGPIQITFADYSGQWPTSVALPTGAPAIQNLSSSTIFTQVQVGTGNFQLVAQIDSVTLVPPPLEVSPATGSFLPQQRFDAALLLPAGTQIASAQITAHGTPLSLYPGPCQLAPPNSVDRPAILCPSADGLLASLGPGPTQITWQVVLSDGTTASRSVVWTLIQ